jgi:glycosyltransferase involved in cell wall biosynthesis
MKYRKSKEVTNTVETKLSGLTVLTPSYNYAKYILECLESVQSEEKNYELVHLVQDGGSSDKTVQVLESFPGKNLHYVVEKDQGQSDALNRALKLADKNSLIGWLNADEYYLSGTLDFFYKAAKANPDVDVFYGNCIFVDKDGRVIRAVPSHRMSSFVLKYYGCFISSCTVFIRASALEKVGWDLEFRRAMDWDLYLSLEPKHKFKYLNFDASAFRVHDEQVTNTPESQDGSEFENLRAKHGIRKTVPKTLAAYALHAFYKALNFSYFKQISIARLKGAKLNHSRFYAEN